MFFSNDIINRKKFYIAILLCVLFFLSLCSWEPIRMAILQYQLNRKNYSSAEEICIKIIRKRKASGTLDIEFTKRMFEKWKQSMEGLIEQEMMLAQKEWDRSRNFFLNNETILDKINHEFNKIVMLEPSLRKELDTWKQNIRLIPVMMPYSMETGFLENDLNPQSGSLSFGHSGGVALDTNLRSIGANLRRKKPVVAVRLRRWGAETRIKPENLSLWLSDDNKQYHRYTGKITFQNRIRSITLDHLDLASQYLKIHCDFKDDKYTFAEDFKSIIEIYGPPDFN